MKILVVNDSFDDQILVKLTFNVNLV